MFRPQVRGATVIHVDPRFTRTSAVADLHVPIRAGADIAFLRRVFELLTANSGRDRTSGCPGWPGMGPPAARRPHAGDAGTVNYAVTACFWSLLVTWMLRGLAASCTGMVRVRTPAA